MERTFAGKRAIVTGGAGGMGRSHARRLARLGADVAIFDIDLNVASRWNEQLEADTIADEIRGFGVDCIAVEVDLTSATATQAAIDQVVAAWPVIDILVNNAGGALTPYDRSAPTVTTDDDARRVVDLNLMSTVNCCRSVAPHLRRPGASIINIATLGVETEIIGGRLALYSAAKAAVVRYTRSLAVELGPEGIRANALSPGLIETARIKALETSRPGMAGEDPTSTIPLRRVGVPDDVSAVVEFLASDLAGYVTGDHIKVGGGIDLI